jgi:hypothetical protein
MPAPTTTTSAARECRTTPRLCRFLSIPGLPRWRYVLVGTHRLPDLGREACSDLLGVGVGHTEMGRQIDRVGH